MYGVVAGLNITFDGAWVYWCFFNFVIIICLLDIARSKLS